jgi:WD40 repeat protein
VWALAGTNELLFSGSSDESIKVWNASTNFSCLRTLSHHRGIVHVLVINGSVTHRFVTTCLDISQLEALQWIGGLHYQRLMMLSTRMPYSFALAGVGHCDV